MHEFKVEKSDIEDYCRELEFHEGQAFSFNDYIKKKHSVFPKTLMANEPKRLLNISNMRFVTCNFSKANFSDIDFTGSNFVDCILNGTNFSSSNFTNVIFLDCDLTDTVLNGSILINANLRRVDLSNASLRSADMSKACLASIKGLTIDMLVPCVIEEVIVSKDDLKIQEYIDKAKQIQSLLRRKALLTKVFPEEKNIGNITKPVDLLQIAKKPFVVQQQIKTKLMLGDIPGLDYLEIPGDGHCLYQAVAINVGQDQNYLQRIVAAHLEENIEVFREFIDLSPGQTMQHYLQGIRAGSEWATYVEIEVLMRLLNRPIVIIGPDRKIRNLKDINRAGEPIFVYYNGHNHYDALLHKKEEAITGQQIINRLTQFDAHSLIFNEVEKAQINTENNYLKQLLSINLIKNFSSQDKKQIMQYAFARDKDNLIAFILGKLGDSSEEKIDKELIKNFGDVYNFETIVDEIIKFNPNPGITSCLSQDSEYFLGKFISLSSSFDEDKFSSNIPFISKYAEITGVRKEQNNVLIFLEDGSTLNIELESDKSIRKAIIEEQRKLNLFDFFQYFFNSKKLEKFTIKVKIPDKTHYEVDESNSFHLKEGEYILSRTTDRKELDVKSYAGIEIVKRIFGLNKLEGSTEKLYEQSFRLTTNNNNLSYHIFLYDMGGQYKIQKVEINRQPFNLYEIKKYQIEFLTQTEMVGVNSKNIDEHVKVIEGIVDESKAKLKYLAEIESIEKDLIDTLKSNDKEEYLDQALDNLLKNDLKVVSEVNLLKGKLINGGNSKIIDLNQKLSTLSLLYKNIGNTLTKEQIFTKLVSNANYAKLITKEKNILVLKTMDLLKKAFSHIELMVNKNLVFFLGNTGAGKSTSVNYFLGVELQKVENKFKDTVIDVIGIQPESAKIGQSIGASETKFVQGFPLLKKITDFKFDYSKLVLCDCPGFEDTRGISYDLATMISLDQTVKKAGSINAIIMVIPYESFLIERANPVIKLFEELENRIPDIFESKNKNLLQSVFLLITKHENHKNAISSFQSRLNGFLGEVNKTLQQLTHENEEERYSLERKSKIWKAIIDIYGANNRRVEFVNVKNLISRKRMIEQFVKSPGIPKEKFSDTMDRPDIQKLFGTYIQLSLHTWQELIIKKYLYELPKEISDAMTKTREKEAELEDKKREMFSLENNIKSLANKLQDAESDIKKFNKLKNRKNIDEQELEALTKKYAEINKLKLEDKKNESKNLHDLIEKLKIKMNENDGKFQKESNELKAMLKFIQDKKDEIEKLSVGNKVDLLHEEKYTSDQVIQYRTWKEGAREKAFNEIRHGDASEFDQGGSVVAKEYTGKFLHNVLINKAYYIVPKDSEHRRIFIEQGYYEDKSKGMLYKAEVQGHNYKIDLGRKIHPDGKRMIYAFETSWQANTTLPYFTITHTIPSVDINEALIINLNAEVDVKIRRAKVLENSLKDIKDTKDRLNHESNQKKKIFDKIQSEAGSLEQFVIESGIEIVNQFVAKTKIEIENKKQNKIDMNNTIAQIQKEIDQERVNLEKIKTKKKQYAILIQQHLEIGILLRKFAEIVTVEKNSEYALGISKKNQHEKLFEVCEGFLKFYDNHIEKLKTECEIDIAHYSLSVKGYEFFFQGLPEKALQIFEYLIRENSDNIDALQGRALVLLYLGKYSSSVELLQQVEYLMNGLKDDDKLAQLWFYQGEMYCFMHSLKLAKACFERVIRLIPKHLPSTARLKQIGLLQSERSWHFDASIKTVEDEKKDDYQEQPYKLIDAPPSDIRKVIDFYQHHPVPKYGIKNIQIIYNPNFNRSFELKMKKLQERKNQSVFKPNWESKSEPIWRKHVSVLHDQMSSQYTDSDFPDIKLLPLWHGTSPQILSILFRTGYANLAETDRGFYGKGIYSSHEAEYAHRVYSKGALILNWVATFSAFPAIHADISDLSSKGNYGNYDSHFIPVVPKDPDNPHEVNYYPTHPNQQHTYIEMVTFETEQCLPRYLVELQPNLLKPITYNPQAFFKSYAMKTITNVNLVEAAQYVYDEYLSKPYVLTADAKGKDWSKTDWLYSYGSKIIQRPNHGLVHTLRSVFYAPYVIESFLSNKSNPHNLSAVEKRYIEDNIKIIQLALMFFAAGRENDMGSREDVATYSRFCKNSSDAFIKYIRDRNLKLDQKIVKQCADAILLSDFKTSPIHAILKICYAIDSMRCFDSEVYSAVCKDIQPYLGKSGCDEIISLVEQSLIATGDRIMAAENNIKKDYKGNLFVKASQDVQQCELYLLSAIEEWECNIFKKKLPILSGHIKL